MANELLGNDVHVFWDNAATGAGNYSAPSWQKQISFGDCGFDPGIVQVEIPLRIGFTTYKGGRSDGSLTFTMNYDPLSAWHTAVRNSIRTGNRIHLAIAEGATIPTANDYLHAWFLVTGPFGAGLDDVATYEVEGKFHHNIGTNMQEIPAYAEGS